MYFIKLILFLALLSISIIAPYFAYISYIPSYDEKYIEITPGESINQVVSKFSSHSKINKIFIKVLLLSEDITSFKVGEYSIKNKTIKEIISIMSKGDTVTYKFKIQEGSTIYDLEKQINSSNLINDCSYLKCLESAFPYTEGILYPDTYFYKKNMKASEILNKSYQRMNEFIQSLPRNNNSSLSKNELLILASIIEKEAGNDDEKNEIAGVFLNRISINMKLQADPTIIYGLLPNFDGDIKKSDILSTQNKYNTYMIKGLPPSPIAISSRSSILAAFNATPSDYLFFVADSKNSHYFSKTYEEHLNKIKELGLDR